MNTSDSYNTWANSYDAMSNKTRDLEGEVLRKTFLNPHYGNILELGCGTGKNTGWLSEKADYVTAIDFSPKMIEKARKKITAENVTFTEADLRLDWPVKPGWANLITCSLVLEHIEDLDFIFAEAARALKRNGKFYICELHPGKQYSGSRARFETEAGLHTPEAFVHHISDFLTAAKAHKFNLLDLNEHFDQPREENIPRLISMVFESGI
ncbi:class I SAM-dependent DNA methyltransferase [Salinimicrobium oceani]|uniref:Class I SAM-dependent methyltransferase n=1 Tax=Salinimicrobium oceani TaxID=2722702 RepID=A0ABX1D030_9FLAO|nr:class I SAM-dependent methyltransferase [Salinimicrobium oceani]NJW52513.1 class I SAM-dependent methyltransferase [Salinimicrobium oceani]